MSAHRLPTDLTFPVWVDIDDPGSGKPISSTRYGQCKISVAAGVAETNTLPDPPNPGIFLAITAYALGAAGTRAITAATKINVTANTIITFSAVDQCVLLLSVPYAGNTNKARWEVILADGASLS